MPMEWHRQKKDCKIEELGARALSSLILVGIIPLLVSGYMLFVQESGVFIPTPYAVATIGFAALLVGLGVVLGKQAFSAIIESAHNYIAGWPPPPQEDPSSRIQEFLQQVGMAMRESADPGFLLQMVLDMALEMVDAQRGSIMLREGDTLLIKAARGLDGNVVKNTRLRIGEGIAGLVAKEGKPILVPNIKNHPLGKQRRRRGRYASDSFVSVPISIDSFPTASIPLIARDKVIGVINVADKRSGDTFTSQDLEVLMALASHAAIAIENAQLQEDLQSTYLQTVKALAEAVEAKDPYTRGHSDRVTKYALAIGRKLGLDEEELKILEHAAALHDVGKIGVPDSILSKPDKLTPAEYELVKRHAEMGERILKPVRSFDKVCQIVRHHHESFDGSGYPDGLAGEEIPLLARILAVADAYDAMTSDRPYRAAFSPDEARRRIEEGKGKQFDPRVCDAFLEVLEEEYKLTEV